MQEALARLRARQLGGVAVGASWKGDHWLIGGVPIAKDETWIVVSLDQRRILDDGCGSDNCRQPVTSKSGYTSHGYWYGPGDPTGDFEPLLMAKCGGPAICSTCKREATPKPVRQPMNIIDFQKAVNDQVDWIQANCPEVLERPVMTLLGDREATGVVDDVFAEEGLVIHAQPAYIAETRGE